MSEDQPIIVIKKKKRGHGGHHGGAWKVAFADFMTAMMAFFLVMWLVGQKDDVRQAVSGYFRDPGKYTNKTGTGALKGSSSALKTDGIKHGLVETPKKAEHLPSDTEKKELKLAAQKIIDELEKEAAFRRLRNNIQMQLTSEGLRIILNESENSPAFFEPGSDKLLQKSAIILVTIARELGRLDNRIVIEGHTDSSPIDRGGYSNWELSADRANAARALMEVSGLSADQIREVRGYADEFPMIQNRPDDPRNRRVTLLVLYQSREYAYDQMEVGDDLLAEIE